MLTISIEIELGWGVHDVEQPDNLSTDGKKERTYLEKLLRKTEECNVPITFDIVGHLLLEACDGTHPGPYDENWFDNDPGTDVDSDPLFYAPEMAQQILDADVGHELCTHTFSHLLCNEASDELLDRELDRVQDLHREIDGPVRSFVPPRHHRPSNDVLSRNGIRVARYAKSSETPTIAHRLKQLTIGPHPVWEPNVRGDVLETYCTRYASLTALTLPKGQKAPPGVFRVLPRELRKRMHLHFLKKTARQAATGDVHVHLWSHLHNLSNRPQWSVLEAFFERLADRPGERMEIRTMAELAEEYID